MIEKEVFDAWKDSEATKQVFGVLLDFRKSMMEAWADGKYDAPKSIEAIAKCQAFYDLAGLDYETIKEFYGVAE